MSSAAALTGRPGAESYWRVFDGPDPAAGNEASIMVPGGTVWDVVAFTVTLVTDATVANRAPSLVVDDGERVVMRVPASNVQTATLSFDYGYIAGLGSAYQLAAANVAVTALPIFQVYTGWRLRTQTGGFQGGDNYGAPRLWVVERPVRGLAAEIAFELANIMREQAELGVFSASAPT